MPFPARLLNDGEEVVLDVRPHWWYLAGPVVVVVVAMAGALAALVAGTASWVHWAALGALVLAVVWMLGRYTRWTSTSLVVTTSRLIRRSGVVARNGREIPLSALTDISYHQSLFERIIGAGDVLIESAGRRGQEVFPDRTVCSMHRRFCMKAGAGILFIIAALSSTGTCPGQNAAEGPADPLPSWNEVQPKSPSSPL